MYLALYPASQTAVGHGMVADTELGEVAEWQWHGTVQQEGTDPGLGTRGRAVIAHDNLHPRWVPSPPSLATHFGQAGAFLASLDFFPS